MSGSSANSRREIALALGLLLIGLVAWLWPIGFGGRMPVGGDVTQFSIGLMAFLRRSIRSGRLPIWNDLWGYGFPGLGESQMGVYYPPHWVLYGLFPLEWAYTASLVIHTILGAMGTYWCARRFEVSPAGSALAGFAWSTSGFFVIHLPHQWGYTVACWMPWAWGLAWLLVQGRGSGRTACLLAMVLAVQILPGHFQLAFYTEFGVVLLTVIGTPWKSGGGRGALRVAAAMLAVAPLAALQLVPTSRLAVLAASRRDYEYLSGFAASPLHLVSYVAPGLFQRSPLWRPLTWDPFHTSPEEHLAYVGLVPLFLGLGMIVRGVRKEPAVRALALVVLATVLFSLGPYVPGFDLWSRLPGFSFFRAPARWSVATGLALCLLAGKGFDAARVSPAPRRSLAWFALVAALAPGLVVLGVELALASTESKGWPAVAHAYDRALNLLPWSGVLQPREGADPTLRPGSAAPTILGLTNLARLPQDDPLLRVRSALARQGIPWQTTTRTFVKSRFTIYRQELAETALLVVALLVVAALARRPRSFGAALIVLTATDLWLVGHHRRIDVGPIRPLAEQSRVLAHLSRRDRGTRTADSTRNLPMVTASAPISSYRTLDLPCMSSLNALALSPPGRPGTDPAIAAALRAAGAEVRVLGPFESARPDRSAGLLPGWDARETVSDRALAGWLFGVDWVEQQGDPASAFTLLSPRLASARAWLVPLTAAKAAEMVVARIGQVDSILDTLRAATPLAVLRPWPERLEVKVEAERPSLVLVSQLADPQWRARWIGPAGTREATILPAFAAGQDHGWQAVQTPGPGPWTLTMEYDARDVRVGLGVSVVSWAVWALAFVRFGRFESHSRGNPS